MTPKRLGMRLNAVREALQLSHEAVATKARTSRKYLSRLDAGRYETLGVLH
jgi:cytoskeletal protein RodZ